MRTKTLTLIASALLLGTALPAHAVGQLVGAVCEQGLVACAVELRARVVGHPAVDRAILRIAVYELLYSLDVPPAVVVNEAVDAAKLLSTDDSPRFVNGVLGQIALITPQLRGA